MKSPLVAMLAVVIAVSTGCNSKDDVKVPEKDLTPEKVEVPVNKPEEKKEPVVVPESKPVEKVKEKAPVKVEPVAETKPAEPVIQDNPAADLDNINFGNDTTKANDVAPSNPSEGDKYTVDGNTYYYIDGVWTHEDFVNPYSK
ncbi:MAG: hypothetical protein NTZ25_00050 [Candidatus Peregrinibacteria bacterium]|nr:hypothetical protein [Candidatus Peregrinibacteria bacterium]